MIVGSPRLCARAGAGESERNADPSFIHADPSWLNRIGVAMTSRRRGARIGSVDARSLPFIIRQEGISPTAGRKSPLPSLRVARRKRNERARFFAGTAPWTKRDNILQS
jgi:hypothetical protein